MKFLLILFSFITYTSAVKLVNEQLNDSWDQFKAEYQKIYSNVEEELERRQIWETNFKLIKEHNRKADSGLKTYRMAMNKFGDWILGLSNGFRKTKNRLNHKQALKRKNEKIPDSVDWRTKGYVTPVQDQGQCGSSWAFAPVGSLEGQHAKKTGNLVALSVQNVLDCSGSYGNYGCTGGFMDAAFRYIIDNGIDTEESYPYGGDGTCKFRNDTIGATATGYVDIPSGDEVSFTNALATVGPISCAVDATSMAFYSSGIYTDENCDSKNPNHGALTVGYGTLGEGQDYYIIKNTWGTSWGLDGYIWVARNKNNMCGTATDASYPLV